MRIGFDNDKYLKIQSEHIKERIGKFGDKLYLEFGGKLFDDFHASRVLPGFHPDSKLQMLMQLSDVAEIVIVISAADIEKNKVRGDLGITYDVDVLRLIGEFEKKGLFVGSVVITKFTGQSAAIQFKEKLEKKGKLIDIFLYDINSETDNDMSDTFVKNTGIYKVLPIGGNNCVIKFGADRLVSDGTGGEEKIAVLNAKQFVSEISFNGQMITMEELDVSDESTTFPYIKAGSGKIIYSKYNFNSQSEEIIIYDAITKVKQVRLNNNVEHAMDLSFTYIINDIPYLLKKVDKSTCFVNLNTQKPEYRLHSDMKFRYMKNDIVVITRMRHRFFFIKKASEYIEAYRILDLHHPVLSTKAVYNSCAESGDDLIIFTN